MFDKVTEEEGEGHVYVQSEEEALGCNSHEPAFVWGTSVCAYTALSKRMCCKLFK